jgi:hypothetical protein
MGGHSSGHLVPQYSDYNFTGRLMAIKATNIGHAKGL